MAEQFLSQDEVDALLEGVDEAPAASSGTGGPIAYDLAKQERIVRGRMPTLEMINERFARNLRIGLFNFMRRNPEISVGPIKVQKYSAFLRGIAVPANINVVAVKPLRGNGLVICDPKLVFTIIDNLFGGSGRLQYRIEGRDFSATEQRIIQRMLDVTLEEYRKAWQGIYPLVLEYMRSEMNPQFATIATPGEIVVTTTFSLEIGELGGELHICIPYSTLEPIRDVLYSTLQGDSMETDKRWVNLLTQQIKVAEIELTAELAHARATVGELMALKAGDFIELDLSDTVTVKSDGVPVFQCRFGTSNGRYAIRIQDILSTAQPQS
ncbi:MAG: flagellar motor switch protein FliM [Burkholderiaceae bacterium]|nr:flagellar motor switch protein FliM [Burkholderiales bacterium]MCZ8102081.1 flagellar motor switch protein FliM [Burkholderiales bacterium]MCZ8340803.1 flagellar motor switch protein FliM [Burkholderiaceae bacterium]